MNLIKGILKWLLVLLFGLIAGLLGKIFLPSIFEIEPFLLQLLILLAIAVFNAAFTRILFNKLWVFLQIILSLTSSTAGLLVIDRLYESDFQFEFAEGLKNFQDILGIQVPSIRDASQILFLLIVSLPFLLFFRKKKRAVKAAKAKHAKSFKTNISDAWKTFTYKVNPVNWDIWASIRATKGRSSRTATSLRVKNSTAPPLHIPSKRAPVAKIKSNGKKKPLIKSSRNKIRLPRNIFHTGANHDVKLTGEEEHVCPYCLEEVRKADPRGVVICKECSTWHHEDCWNLTGACGIAHRNEL